MVAQALADRLSRRGIHYGWVIVAVTFLTSLTTAGAMGLPGALILPLSREFGWDVAEISSAIAIRLVLFGLMAPVAAALIENYGVRRIVIAAITLIVSGLLLAPVMTQVWHLVLLWGIVVGIGTGMTALVLGAIIATRWFVARRGLVVGMLTASSATGQLVFLPVAAWLVDHVGWRFALVPTIGALIAVGLLVVVFMRDRLECSGDGVFLHENLDVMIQAGPKVLAIAFADRVAKIREPRPARRLQRATDMIDNPGSRHLSGFSQPSHHLAESLVLFLVVPQHSGRDESVVELAERHGPFRFKNFYGAFA